MPKTGRGSVARRRKHLAALCSEHEIKHEEVAGSSHGSCDPEHRAIRTPPVSQTLSYYLALHEIGHVVCGSKRTAPPAPQEVAAWIWALDVAIEGPTDNLRRRMIQAVWHYLIESGRAYQERFRSRGDRPPGQLTMIPSPDDPFWDFFRRVEPDSGRVAYLLAKIDCVTENQTGLSRSGTSDV